MTTSGTYTAIDNLEIADAMVEAFERVGVKPDGITGAHINSALRSLQLAMPELQNAGMRQWKMESFTLTPTSIGQTNFTLNARVLRVLTCVSVKNDVVTPILGIGRGEFDNIHNPEEQGSLPTNYFLDKQRAAPVLYIWPTFDSLDTDVRITAFVKVQDFGDLSETMDIPYIWMDAVCAAWARRLAEKYAPERLEEKAALQMSAFKLAGQEDRVPTTVSMSVDLRPGRR